MDDLVGNVGVVENAGGDVDHSGASGTRSDTHPTTGGSHGFLGGSSDMLSIRVLQQNTVSSPLRAAISPALPKGWVENPGTELDCLSLVS